jgi:hypothetical protein
MDTKYVWLTVECPECGDVLQSHYINEIRRCKCGQLVVEGGNPCFDDKQPLEGFKVVHHSKYEAIEIHPFYCTRITYPKPRKNNNKRNGVHSRTKNTDVKAKFE